MSVLILPWGLVKYQLSRNQNPDGLSWVRYCLVFLIFLQKEEKNKNIYIYNSIIIQSPMDGSKDFGETVYCKDGLLNFTKWNMILNPYKFS